MPNAFIGSLAVMLYIVTAGLLGLRLSQPSAIQSQYKTWAMLLGWSAITLHGIVLIQIMQLPDGINFGFFNALSFTGWLIALLLLLTTVIWPLENLGIMLLPLNATTLTLAMLFPSERIVSDYQPWPLEVHIFISALAYSLLALAAVQALLLAIQHRRLRNHHPGGFMRGIPPLTTMESLLFQMLSGGFILLSLGLISGLFFLEDIFAQHLVHKTLLSIIAWILFATLLWGRWRFGWRGPRAIRWTLSGFIALMLAYFGSKLVLELLLA